MFLWWYWVGEDWVRSVLLPRLRDHVPYLGSLRHQQPAAAGSAPLWYRSEPQLHLVPVPKDDLPVLDARRGDTEARTDAAGIDMRRLG